MPERRQRKLVNQFQFKLIGRMSVYWAVYQFTLWNLMFCWKLIESGRGNLWGQYVQFSREFAPMLLCFLILVPAFIWDAVKFYHRIAGPLVRFRRSMRDIANGGSLTPIRLREGDELMELEDVYNDMIATLSKRGAGTPADQTNSDNLNQSDNQASVEGHGPVEHEISHV